MGKTLDFETFSKAYKLNGDLIDGVLNDVKRYGQSCVRIKSGKFRTGELLLEEKKKKKAIQRAVGGIFKVNDLTKENYGKQVLTRKINICDVEECQAVINELLDGIQTA